MRTVEKKEFERKFKEDKPVVAICYDFDKTLSPDDMQAQGFIQSVGYDIEEFWKKSDGLASTNDMDQNLAYMYLMKTEAEGVHVFNKKTLSEYGSKVKLFPGVKEWFERIREYGKEHGVIVEHYIISSGLKEMIEGTEVASSFEKIYASSFYFNDRGIAEWPAQVVNYTNKTQFLFRIEKGILDVNDSRVNDYFAPEDLRIPFRNMIYIGDSDTDVPCMKLVNSYGGHSIGVYNPDTKDKQKVYRMIKDNRIKYFAPADYSEGNELDLLVKNIIDRTVANEILEEKCFACKKEQIDVFLSEKNDNNVQMRRNLIISLSESRNFQTTHTLMKDLLKISDWTQDEINILLDIALENHPVRYIINDPDIKLFYKQLISKLEEETENAKKLGDCIK